MLTVLIFACKDDEVTKVLKNCNVATYSDDFNDADTTFVDFGRLTVDFKDDTIVVKMELATIPSEITFNNDALAINALNFFWEVAFDIDQSGARDAGDLSFIISKFKFEQGEVNGTILDNSQKNIWEQVDNNSRKAISNLTDVTIAMNLVTLKVPITIDEKLRSIECDTKVYFFSGYFTGTKSYSDHSPN